MHYTTIPFEVKLPDQALAFSLDSLYAYLDRVLDKRKARGLLYPLRPLLAIAVLAKLAGQNHIAELTDWAKLRAAQLCPLFGLKRAQMPHLTTWGRVLGDKIDPIQLEAVLDEFFRAQLAQPQQVPPRGSVIIVIDGKALRGSITAGHTQGTYMMAAYLPTQGVVIGQVEVANGEVKENEIVAAPKLLLLIEKYVAGAVLVGDAMQCQRRLSVQIRTARGDWMWFVKKNQPQLLRDLEILFANEPLAAGHSPYPTDFSTAKTIEKRHGRLEERILTASSMLNEEYLKWPGVAQVFKLERIVHAGQAKVKHEVRYGITSLPPELADAARLMQIARAEWGIENQLHYRRDYSLREDWSRLRRGTSQQVNAMLNNTVVGLMSLKGVANMQAQRREFNYNPTQALSWLTEPPLSSQ